MAIRGKRPVYVGLIILLCSVAQLCLTLCDPMDSACQASLSLTMSQSFLKLMSIESVMPSNHFMVYPPVLLLPSIFPSIRVFSNESTFHIRWPKYWNISFSISPSNDYSGLISFRIDWLDLQESSPRPQYKSTNPSALNLLYGPTLTAKHDYCKKP